MKMVPGPMSVLLLLLQQPSLVSQWKAGRNQTSTRQQHSWKLRAWPRCAQLELHQQASAPRRVGTGKTKLLPCPTLAFQASTHQRVAAPDQAARNMTELLRHHRRTRSSHIQMKADSRW